MRTSSPRFFIGRLLTTRRDPNCSPGVGSTTLYAFTLFLAAALLFSVQPMVARGVLPYLGGAPAVWTTCTLFFQGMLFVGYLYADVVSTRLSHRLHLVVHLGVVAAACLALPVVLSSDLLTPLTTRPDPTWGLLRSLATSAGIPVFLLATTSPLLQRWFAGPHPGSGRESYVLFALSNAGSLIALVSYPLWLERSFDLPEQSRLWSTAFVAYAVLVGLCAIHSWTTRTDGVVREATRRYRHSIGTWLSWVGLAVIPSCLMLAVTSEITTDLAAMPLLWVIPLGLYLLSFIVVFARQGDVPARIAARALPWLVMPLAVVLGVGLVQPFWIVLHLAAFFAAAVLCHGELSQRRPPASGLTSFYLAMAGGGALGGVFNALVAPVIFDRIVEYPAAVVAACLVLAAHSPAGGRPGWWNRWLVLPPTIGLLAAWLCTDLGGVTGSALGVVLLMVVSGLTLLVLVNHRRRPACFALTVAGLLAASGLSSGVSGRPLYRDRDFFGVLRVTEVSEGGYRRLFHGSTLHGQQSQLPGRRREPLTYFTPSGPIGRVFEVFRANRPASGPAPRVGVTGVGAGTLAAYAEAGDHWTFFEIDPAVIRVATDPALFTYLSDSRADPLRLVSGDARLTLALEPDHSFDLLVLDAFSSDAIPMHLLSREALRLYRKKLAPGGLLAFNITNRYVDLVPVVAMLAADAGWVCRARVDAWPTLEQKQAGKQGSIWAVMAARNDDLGVVRHDRDWFEPQARPGDRVWTDASSSLVDHLRWSAVVDPTKPPARQGRDARR